VKRLLSLAGAASICVLGGACQGAMDPQSPQSGKIADLLWLTAGLGTVLFLLTMAILAYALFHRRRQAEARTSRELPLIIGGGVVLPVVVMFVLMGFTVEALNFLAKDPPADALRIDVTGRDWWWDVSYPDLDVRTANEIHIPVGETIGVTGTAEDVIHSFWVSQLNGKVDFIPGKPNEFKLRADKAGTFRGQCAEYCGVGHTQMTLVVIAQPRDEFDRWVEQQRAPANMPVDTRAERGRDIFFSSSCIACHGIKGTEANATVGPDLTHFASRDRFAGDFWQLNAENLATWVTQPTDLKPGANMPGTPFSQDDKDALVAFLLSLK
jgi:cytochrome c oxidase subunit 2